MGGLEGADGPRIVSTAPAKLPEGDIAMRAALVRRAMDLLGAGAYAEAMGVADRTARAWAAEGGDPNRPVSDRILRDTIRVMVAHRQSVGALISGVRASLGEFSVR